MSASFGPNRQIVERFLARLARLDVADFLDVVRAWREALRGGGEAWYQAEDAVGEAIARTHRDEEMWRLQHAVHVSFCGGPWYERPLPGARTAAAEAASEYIAASAALALLVADTLAPRHLATLHAPFGRVIPLAELAPTAAQEAPAAV